jgi:hypothetical protein
MFMIEILKDAWKAIVGLLIVVFLPKQIFIAFREFVLFGFKSVVKYWIVNFLTSVLIAILYFKTVLFNGIDFVYLIIALISLIFICSTFFHLISIYLKLNKNNSLVIYGSYSSKEKEYLFLDLDAELLNDRLKRESEQLNRNSFVLKSNIINLTFIELPKFTPIILGYRGTIRLFEKFVLKRKHLSSLYFLRDVSDQKILTNIVEEPSNFINGDLPPNLIALQNKISNEKIDIKEIAVINLKLYVLVFGQTYLDSFLVTKDYNTVKDILDDTEKLLLEIKEQIEQNVNSEIKEFTEFNTFWKSNILRYRAILLIEQDELRGAISYTINAIKLNPYYPYSNYETFKINFTKRYGVELSYSIESKFKEMEVEGETDFDAIRARITNTIVARDSEFNTKLLLEVIRKDTKQQHLKFLEEELKTLDSTNIAVLLLKSDVLKILPDETEKVQEVYLGRIEEIVSTLYEILALDGSFALVKTKVGSLHMSRGFHTDDEVEVEKGLKIWTEGMHFLTELGFKTQ